MGPANESAWRNAVNDYSLQDATDAIVEHGCPICGEEPNFYFIDGPQGIGLRPCNHTVTPADAKEMERLEAAKGTGEASPDDER